MSAASPKATITNLNADETQAFKPIDIAPSFVASHSPKLAQRWSEVSKGKAVARLSAERVSKHLLALVDAGKLLQ